MGVFLVMQCDEEKLKPTVAFKGTGPATQQLYQPQLQRTCGAATKSAAAVCQLIYGADACWCCLVGVHV